MSHKNHHHELSYQRQMQHYKDSLYELRMGAPADTPIELLYRKQLRTDPIDTQEELEEAQSNQASYRP